MKSKDYGMCQDCDNFFRGYCFCTGCPDEIIGEIIICEFYKERKDDPKKSD